MFYQNIQIIRFFITKFSKMQQCQNLQKTSSDVKFNSLYTKFKTEYNQSPEELNLRKLKFAEIEKKKFYFPDTKKKLSQTQQYDSYIQDLEKLIQEKEIVQNTNYSKAEGALKQSLSILSNHYKYTTNYIKLSEENIRREKSLLENDPQNIQNIFRISRQEAVNKTKYTLNNIKQKMKKQEIEIKERSKILVDKQSQIDTNESVELGFRREIQKRKLKQKLNKQMKQNAFNKNKVTQLQFAIQKKEIQIQNLGNSIKKLQNRLMQSIQQLFSSISYQYEKMKTENGYYLQESKKKLTKTTNQLKLKRKQSTLHKKPYYIQENNLEIMNQILDIKINQKVNKLHKYTDTNQLMQKQLENLRLNLQKNIEQQNQAIETQKSISFNHSIIKSKKFIDEQIQVQIQLQIKSKKQFDRRNTLKNQNQSHKKNILPYPQPQRKSGFIINSQIQNPDLISICTTPPLPPKQYIRQINKKQTKSLHPKSSKINNDGQIRSKIQQLLNENRSQNLYNTTFCLQNNDLFIGQQQAKNFESLSIMQLKNTRKLKTVENETNAKNNKTKHSVQYEKSFQTFLQKICKFVQQLKRNNIKNYIKFRNYLRYPFSSIKYGNDLIWEKTKIQQPDLNATELRKIFQRIKKVHNECPSKNEICIHMINFCKKIGFHQF